jgi:hypothetical protein
VTCCGQGGKITMRQIHFKTELKGEKDFGGNENQQYDIWGETKKF